MHHIIISVAQAKYSAVLEGRGEVMIGDRLGTDIFQPDRFRVLILRERNENASDAHCFSMLCLMLS